MNEAFTADTTLQDSYRRRFETVLSFVSRNFPFGFRKSEKSTATPRARFEAIAIGVDRALANNPELANRSPSAINVSSWINLPEFQEITSSDGANAIARLRGRINFVKDKLAEHGDD
jgi:hypothetical protein